MKWTVIKISFLFSFMHFFNHKLQSQKRDSFIVLGQRERSAEYPGGQAEMHKFLAQNLRYPKEGATCVEGNVYVNFCVQIDGSITHIKVVRGLCEECDAEAMRVIGIMPKWKPALEYGTQKPIKSYYTVPCRLRLE